ncbi:sigma-70 family RNA polymerase sigma factor [Microbacterium betulae]|uniref:Sigma-70 family RNA polymerase sigma factor n=1 Tax=Microbacterium betulae TaxID=2981139 RepID=A0AA97I4S9_9MICO|nr:sigma-70 family RNA polymerase sigma factor [Microbacterium sp. AB]WOF22079.1 sigma-70 family RNA polymerase sigma factor [Microbacterium sp. AB]
MPSTSPAATAWRGERDRLVGIAYRMLGDFGHAEDVVSEVAVEALRAETDTDVRSWPAWLTTTCVRRSIDRLRQLAATREEYPGPWLPEPVATGLLPDEVVANRELLSITVLHLAEQLTPEARAAVVLHRAFGMSAVEIAPLLDRSPDAVRQLISRGERRLRIDDHAPAPACGDPEAVARIVRAIEQGDVTGVLALLDEDAVLWTDGGGRVKSALNPIFGADRIARFFLGILDKAWADSESGTPGVAAVDVNGQPALSLSLHGVHDVLVLEFSPDGGISELRRVANPEKLTRAFRLRGDP